MNMVDDYIKNQEAAYREICRILRKLILETFPGISEEMKYGVPYYGNIFYIVALKTHVNLGFSIKGLSKEEIKLFEGTGKTTRHIKIKTKEDINEEKLIELLKMVK